MHNKKNNNNKSAATDLISLIKKIRFTRTHTREKQIKLTAKKIYALNQSMNRWILIAICKLLHDLSVCVCVC